MDGTKGQVLTKQSKTNGDANWEDIEANEVYIGKAEEAPETAKIIIEDEDFVEGSTLSKAEVYVGAEEPTTGEKVWFRKGKNKFNPNDKTNGYLNINGSFTSATDWTCSGFIEINSNKYILSANTTATRVIWCEYDGSMNIIGTRHEVAYGNPIAIVSVNTKYIRVCFNDGTATDIQLEPGSKATSYEAYIEQKIFVRNSNGVYEEFIKKSEEVYSTEEQRIGTWIDGKPLYRIIKEYDVSAKETQSNDISSIPYDTIFINFGKSFNRWVANSSSSIIWNTSDNDKGNVWINYEKKLNILNSSNAARHYWITLEYTKTTD